MRTSMLVLLFLTLSATAHAQIEPPSLFVEGAVFGDRDGSRSGPPLPITAGVSGTIGFRISRGFSVRFDADIPGEHAIPTYAYSDAFFRVEETGTKRTLTYEAMFAWHSQPARKVDVALMAGFGTAVSKTTTAGFEDTFNRDGSLLRHTDLNQHYSYTNGSIALGTDVAVQVTRHVAVVPELRWYLFSEYGTVVRPKIALRWTF